LPLSTALRHREGAEVQLYSFLTSVLYGSKLLTSHPSCFTSRKGPHYQLYRRVSGTQSWSRQCPCLQPSHYTNYAIQSPWCKIGLNKIKVEESVCFLLIEIHHFCQKTWKDVMTSIKCEVCFVQ